MSNVMVVDNITGIGTMMSLDDAADATCIHPIEVAQALEAFGVCNSLDYTILDTVAAEDVLEARSQ